MSTTDLEVPDQTFVREVARAAVKARLRLHIELLRPANLRRGLQIRSLSRHGRAQYSDEKLRRLIAHAAAHVPYYRALLRDVSDPTLASLPVLRKIVLQSRFADLIARNPRGGMLDRVRLCVDQTSGSTGSTASHLKATQEVMVDDFALLHRILDERRVRRRGTMFHLGLHDVLPPVLNTFVLPPRGYVTWNFLPFVTRIDDDYLDEARALTLLASRVDFIWGMPSRIHELVRLEQTLGICHRPTAILSSYEQLVPAERAMIEEHFKTPVTNVYSSSEVGLCGWECSAGRIHFPPEFTILEIVNDDGDIAFPGEAGEVVLTSLKSWVMPLLRYAPGDRGIMAEPPCECGNSDPALATLLGREVAPFVTSTGKECTPYKLMGIVNDLNLAEYQLVQDAPGELHLIVPPNTVIPPDALERLRRRFLMFIEEPTEFRVDGSGEFVLAPSGKRNPFVQRIGAEHAVRLEQDGRGC